MDKDRIEGTAHQAKGAIKEAAGKITGDSKTEAEGAAEKAAAILQQQQRDAEEQKRRDEAFRRQVEQNKKKHNSAAAQEGKTWKTYLP